LRELMSSSRNCVICSTFCRPMLPDESRANTMSEPRKQAANHKHNANVDTFFWPRPTSKLWSSSQDQDRDSEYQNQEQDIYV